MLEATLQPNPPPAVRQQMLAGLCSSPIWAAAMRNARSIRAEVDSYATYQFDPAEFRDFSAPTVLLIGSHSSPVMRRWVGELRVALPEARTTYKQRVEDTLAEAPRKGG